MDIPHDVLWRDTENPAKYWVMDTDETPWKVKSEHPTLDMAERVCKRLNDKRGREQYQVLGFGVENSSSTEKEIRAIYTRMKQPLTATVPFTYGKRFDALSQYGYPLRSDFDTKKTAENYVIKYYSDKMHLLRQ